MEIRRWIEENLKKVNLKRLTDSKLKAKTLERLGVLVCLEKFIVVKFLDFHPFTTASYESEALQAKENSTEFPQTDG